MPHLILITFAVRERLRPFQERVGAGAGFQWLLTGIGPRNAERSIHQALDGPGPDFVLTCGFAGGLNPALPGGAVVFAADEGSGLASALGRLGAHPARFHTAERVITRSGEKQALRRATGADAVEMESGVIRSVCRDQSLPCAIVRVISDTAAEDLPLDFNRLVDADWRLRYGKLAAVLLQSPARVPALLRLRRQTRFAAGRLAGVLAALMADRTWLPAMSG